jgi:hypothetical protein
MEEQQEPVKVKANPPKKPRSEKQIAHSKKMSVLLRERREYHTKVQEEEATNMQATAPSLEVQHEAPKPTKKKVNLAPAPEYITKTHLEKFKTELLAGIPQPGERVVEKPVERIVEKPIDRIVERPVERIVEREKVVHLSGNALLDKIFFGK